MGEIPSLRTLLCMCVLHVRLACACACAAGPEVESFVIFVVGFVWISANVSPSWSIGSIERTLWPEGDGEGMDQGRLVINYGRGILPPYSQQGDILYVPEAHLGIADESRTWDQTNINSPHPFTRTLCISQDDFLGC